MEKKKITDTVENQKTELTCITESENQTPYTHWGAGHVDAVVRPHSPSANDPRVWVEFFGFLLCSDRFFSGYSGFPLSSKYQYCSTRARWI